MVNGHEAFTLFDTFGFPLDLTELICRENGLTLDEEEFNQNMQAQKERARNAAAVENGDWVEVKAGTPKFVGYDFLKSETEILRYRQIKQKNKTFYQIVLAETPFYGEMGGEVGDRGYIEADGKKVQVIDTKRENNLPVCITTALPEDVTATFTAVVDEEARIATECNHSATHILDYCLREVLGTHVEQKGSLVTPDSLRFDFSHFQKVTDEEIRKVEHMANKIIRQNIQLEEHRDMPISEAMSMGAIALFGEKYGDSVRVIKFGPSVELCGGCHIPSTGQIGMIRIISESSVAAGVRRIEAITGQKVEDMLDGQQDIMRSLKETFNNAPNLISTIKNMVAENAEVKKQIEQFKREKEVELKKQFLAGATELNGIKVVRIGGDLEPDSVRNIAFQLRAENQNLIVVAGTAFAGKPMLTVAVSDDLLSHFNASNLVKSAAKLIQGGGGGQPHFAQAGGRNCDGLQTAVGTILDAIKG